MSDISDKSRIPDTLGAGAGPARPASGPVNFAWEQLTGSVHRCPLPFCDVTIGLVPGRDGALLFDTGTTLAEAAAIDADVRGLTGRAVTHIALTHRHFQTHRHFETHRHFDHVLGSSFFGAADVYCAPEVAAEIQSGARRFRDEAVRRGADPVHADRAIAALRPPGHVTREAVVDLGARAVTITHPGRGHTTADLVVVAPPSDDAEPVVVFTGDLVEESADPATDADSDVAAWPATLGRVLRIGGPNARYVPGHGRVVDAQFVRRQREWLSRRAATGRA